MYKVYIHCSSIGIPFYVGKGKDNRPFDFIKRPKDWKDFVSINGINVLIMQEFTDAKEAFIWEQKYIKFIGRLDKNEGTLLNKTDGGLGSNGVIVSNETREALRTKGKKRIFTEEHRLKISLAKKGIKRAEFTSEHKEKISKANIGKVLSNETKSKMKGIKRTEEHRKILSEKQKKFWEDFRASKLR